MRGGLISIAIAIGMALLGVVLIGVGSIGAKAAGAIVGGSIVMLGALVSGNPRLYCLWGLLLTFPFNLSKRFGGEIPKLGGENSFRIEVSDPFWLALLAFLAMDVWRGRQKTVRVPKVTFVWIAIMLIGCVWVAVGSYRMTAAHEVVRMVKMMLLFLAVCNELQRPGRFMHCAVALACGVVLQSLVGVLQYATRVPLGLKVLGETETATTSQLLTDSIAGGHVYRVGGFLLHPNVFGIFLAVCVTFVISVFLARIGRWRKVLFFSGIILGIAALIGTFSRSSWLSFAAAVALLLLLMMFHHRMRRQAVVLIPCAAISVLLVGALFAGPIAKRVFESTPYAAAGRAEWNQDALRMIAARPVLGWGMNAYSFAVPPFTKYGARGLADVLKDNRGWVPTVHNAYLLWWAELGAIGLALQLLILASIIRIGIRNLHVQNELLFAMNAACVSGILALLVDAFFSLSLAINPILRLFWLLAGIIMAVHYWRCRHEAPARVVRSGQVAA